MLPQHTDHRVAYVTVGSGMLLRVYIINADCEIDEGEE